MPGLALLTFSGADYSAGGNYSSDFEPVMDLIAQEKYDQAIDMPHDELDNDPDICLYLVSVIVKRITTKMR